MAPESAPRGGFAKGELHMKLIGLAFVVCTLGSFGCSRPDSTPGALAATQGDAPVAVRAEAGSIWWGRHTWSEPRRAWTLPASGPVENLAVERGAPADGWVVSFRQGGVAWRGSIGAQLVATRELQEASDLGRTTAAR